MTPAEPNANLFVALRAGFPADLDAVAIETLDTGLAYTWRDLERASAMFANLIDSLDLPPASRIAVQAEKSVESLLFYLAVLRAGHVYLPLNTAYKSDEIGYFLGDAEPAVFVCAPRDFVWASKLAFAKGTTFVFTKHLAAISPEFKQKVGQGTTVNWPESDKIVAAPKNDGVTATIKQTPGAIGYIEWGYAKLTKADVALLQNKSGKYVAAGGEGGALALASAEFPPDLIVWVDDPADPGAYPIASFTWQLFYQKQDPQKADYLRKLVAYGLTEGQKIADSMGYIPLPPSVIEKVKAASAKIQ